MAYRISVLQLTKLFQSRLKQQSAPAKIPNRREKLPKPKRRLGHVVEVIGLMSHLKGLFAQQFGDLILTLIAQHAR